DNIHIGVLPTNDDKEIIKIDVIEEDNKSAAYDNIIKELKNKKYDEKQYRNAIIKKDDYYRLFRFFYEYLQMENETKIIMDIANNLPGLKDIQKKSSKLTVLKNALKFIEKLNQDMQRILNENETLHKEKNLYLELLLNSS
ncbi:41776_t:CDS:2, partial [Gigaspora margarita]